MNFLKGPAGLFALLLICAALLGAGAEPPAANPAESVNVPSALDPYAAAVTAYTIGADRQPLASVEEIIRKTPPSQYPEIERWLLARFQDPQATSDAKEFVCRALQRIASARAIPVLAPLLPDKHFSQFALCALQQVPESAVDDALREAAAKSAGQIRIGIVNALGERRQAANAAALTSLLDDPDEAVAIAAVVALGKLGDAPSVEALAKARASAKPAVQAAAARAQLDHAERLLVLGQTDAAAKLFDGIYASESSQNLRSAAFLGRVRARGEAGNALLLEAVKAESPEVWNAAMQCVRETPGAELTLQLAALVPPLSGFHKAQLLYALADRGDRTALPAVMAALQDPDEAVRDAVYAAVAALGDGATAVTLAKTASTGGSEAEAIRDCLKRIPGKEISAALIQALETPEVPLKLELIRTLAARRAVDAQPPLLLLARDPDAAVRRESLKALGALAQEDALPQLLELLAAADADNEAVAEALAAVANRAVATPDHTAILLDALGNARGARAKCCILDALANAADSPALNALRAAVQDADPEVQDTAMRRLAAWPSPQALDLLLEIAKTSPRLSHRILALRGHIRLLELVQEGPPGKKLQAYQNAMTLATRIEEQKQILSGVASIASPETLDFVAPMLTNPELVNEAAVAMIKIAAAIASTHPGPAEAALVQVQQSASDEDTKKAVQELLDRLRAPHP